MLIFKRKTDDQERRVIFSTNLAETSLTIDNIVFVIDCGFCKEKNYDPRTNVESLMICPVSKTSAEQRAGRAGRVMPGKCFWLYTEWSYLNQLEDFSLPEIQRTNLNSLIISLKRLNVKNLVNFDFIDAPNYQRLVSALNNLYNLKLLDDQGELTELGI